ncbi:MAG: hypothetical protein IPK50_07195 [Fibrobacterota bacterium]|nr:hypothetical protein [Fibrobacterota bacterium]QQS06679.1 MAG: hypothetical protein IPK50_07195 [Fibrobacterota bacterium]
MNHCPPKSYSGHVRSLLVIGLLVASSIRADLVVDFSKANLRPGNVGGVFGFAYPDSATRHSPSHRADLAWTSEGSAPSARLRYELDGPKYPSAGFGAMLAEESQALDLRDLKGIHVRLWSSVRRTVRVTVVSNLPAYGLASDTGVAFGYDLDVGPAMMDTVIGVENLALPIWLVGSPPLYVTEALGSATAIQFNVSCESSTGTCQTDTGRVQVEKLVLKGVGGGWPTPPQGSCTGEKVLLSDFQGQNAKRNGWGGWWYVYTDANSDSSTRSRGRSQILSAADTANLQTWTPDSAKAEAWMRFRLTREQAYSGWAALETQAGPPDAKTSQPVPVDRPGLSAISFRLSFDSAFPASLGGVNLKVKRSGTAFEGGRDLQIRIPYTDSARTWCVDLAALRQPNWSGSARIFEPDSLLAVAWEVKLGGVENEASGGFRLSQVEMWKAGTAIRPRSTSVGGVRRVGGDIEFTRQGFAGAANLVLVDSRGRVLSRTILSADQNSIRLAAPSGSPSWLHVSGVSARGTFPVAAWR